jgi:iron complex outermembrane receptor protein
MRVSALLWAAVLAGYAAFGQEAVVLDSLPVHMLESVTIYGLEATDTLQSFAKGNKSATTEDILFRLAGTNLIRRGSYGQEPILQGMSGGQLNVTLDGMKIFGACTDKMDPVTIYTEPRNLESIHTELGSSGNRTGSTVGGAIDLKLLKPSFREKGLHGSIGGGYQAVSQGGNLFANMNYAADKQAMNISLNYRGSGNYEDGSGEEVRYTQYSKFNGSAGFKWRIASDTLIAQVLTDQGRNIGFAALPMDVGYANANLYSLTWKRKHAGWFHELLVKAYYNAIQHEMDDTHRDSVSMHMDMPGFSITAGLFAEGNLVSSPKHQVQFRTDYYHNRAKAEMTMYPENANPMYMETLPQSGRQEAGLYLEDIYRIGAKTRIKSNLRVDLADTYVQDGIGQDELMIYYPGMNSRQTTFRKSLNATLQWLPTSTIILETHAGIGERQPTLAESFGFFLFNQSDGYDYLGNPQLKIEKTATFDLSLHYINNSFQVDLQGFYRVLPDFIYGTVTPALNAMTPGANGVKVYSNVDYATMTGAEINLLARISGSLKFISLIKYVNGRFSDGSPMPMIPPLTSVSSIAASYGRTSMQFECEAATAQHHYNTGYGEDFTPGYYILNLRAQHRAAWQNLLISVGAENLLNNYYHAHLDWGNIPRPGRNICLSITLSL